MTVLNLLPVCLCTGPSGPPRNFSVSVHNSTHAGIVWEIPSPSEQNGAITHYQVKVIETGSLHMFPQQTVFSPSVMLSDLHPYYTYQVQVTAGTSVGVGPYTPFYFFRMDEAGMNRIILYMSANCVSVLIAPSSPPQNLTVESVSSTSILLSWKPPVLSNQNGQIRSYNIVVTDIQFQTERMYTVGPEHNQLLVDMLHPYRTYEISVAATTIATGTYSNPVTVTTKEDGM